MMLSFRKCFTPSFLDAIRQIHFPPFRRINASKGYISGKNMMLLLHRSEEQQMEVVVMRVKSGMLWN
jgi:hypothetical protein